MELKDKNVQIVVNGKKWVGNVLEYARPPYPEQPYWEFVFKDGKHMWATGQVRVEAFLEKDYERSAL